MRYFFSYIVYYIIPVVREMISQAECKDENFITRQEAFHLLRKLRIVSSYVNLFLTLDFGN